MNRTIFSLLVLLLFGLLSQPVTAQRSPQRAQQEAEKGVAKMSEKEMRALLPTLKARYEELRNIIKTGNYSQLGNDGFDEAFSKAAIADEYICVTADINAIEKRLGKIDEKKKQEELEKKKQEEELEKKKQEELEKQRQEELERQRQAELEKQRQAEFQESFERNLEESQERYNECHKDVDDNANAASNENMALKSVMSYTDPNSKPITANMMDEPLFPTSTSKSGDISSKFNNKPKETKEEPEETKEEESEETKEEVPKEDEIRKLIMEIQNDINNF